MGMVFSGGFVDRRAGKSTLVNLLCRLYDSTKGQLRINGHDVEEYDPTELRKHIAVLFQEKGIPRWLSTAEF
jgi:ABC-type multidrug transport system fused ATPase/permease subunit